MTPRVRDDGEEVLLDLHGVTVRDAEAYIRRAARLAFERGRRTVRVIHGTSSSDLLYRNTTIKHMLYEMLESGKLSRYVASDWREEGQCLLSIRVGENRLPARITALEIVE